MKTRRIIHGVCSAESRQRKTEGQHEIVGFCASNAEVKAYFADGAHSDIDLILSDIQLGDGLSFDSLRMVPDVIPVIFTTAYDHYAVQAFRFNSILIKKETGMTAQRYI